MTAKSYLEDARIVNTADWQQADILKQPEPVEKNIQFAANYRTVVKAHKRHGDKNQADNHIKLDKTVETAKMRSRTQKRKNKQIEEDRAAQNVKVRNCIKEMQNRDIIDNIARSARQKAARTKSKKDDRLVQSILSADNIFDDLVHDAVADVDDIVDDMIDDVIDVMD